MRPGVSDLEALVRTPAALEDLERRAPIDRATSWPLDSPVGVIDPARAAAATKVAADMGMKAQPVFTYLANSLRSHGLEVPYSLVTAMDLRALTSAPSPTSARRSLRRLSFNDWTARELQVVPGDPVRARVLLVGRAGSAADTQSCLSRRCCRAHGGRRADRNFAPAYPGITDADTIGSWNPPFPIDLRRVRKVDEDYWKKYRTTPKSVHLARGRTNAVAVAIWRSHIHAARARPESVAESDAQSQYASRLRAALDPLALGPVGVRRASE